MYRRLVPIAVACLVMLQAMAIAAQDAPGEPQGEPVEVFYIQTADASTLTLLDAPEGGATHALVMDQYSTQTVYVSEQSEHLAGTVSTEEVLDGFAEAPDDLPQAALVAQTESGDKEIVPLVIHSGEEDSAADTISYQVSVLTDKTAFDYSLDGSLVMDVTETANYGMSSLFVENWCLEQHWMLPLTRIVPCQ